VVATTRLEPLSAADAELFAAARLRAARSQPYLATALFAMVPVVRPGFGTFAVDRYWRVYLDMDQAREWGVAATAAVLVHEAHHLVRGHHERARRVGATGERHRDWNLAADAAINDDLVDDGLDLPDPRDRRFETERGTLRLLVQAPTTFTADLNELRADDFAHPTYRALFTALAASVAAGVTTLDPAALAGGDPVLEQLVVVLATERLLRDATPAYAAEHAAGVRLLATAREIQALKSKLQRTNPVEDPLVYNRMFASLVDLEARRKTLLALAAGPAM